VFGTLYGLWLKINKINALSTKRF